MRRGASKPIADSRLMSSWIPEATRPLFRLADYISQASNPNDIRDFFGKSYRSARLEEGLKHRRLSTADDWLEQSAHHQRVLIKQRLP